MIVVIDTETTGIDPKAGDTVIEIAAVAIDKIHDEAEWHIKGFASSFVAPGRRIPPGAKAIHHIKEEMVRDAPKLRLALSQVITEAVGNVSCISHFVAHNAEFDRGFIGGFFPVMPWLCTWRAALHVFPDAPIHSNQGLRYTIPEIENDVAALRLDGNHAHRALYDAITTACLLKALLRRKTMQGLCLLQDKPVLQILCRFGKHRGVKWSDVPRDYLSWLLRQDNPPFDRDVRHTARYWLKGGPRGQKAVA